MELTRLLTARILIIVWKEIIDTVYVIMYDQNSNALAHLEIMQSWICLDIFLVSNNQNVGINRLFL